MSSRTPRRNYWAHGFEGALFLGGLAFVNPVTLLPRMCDALGAPRWLVALAPSLLTLGFILPSLFMVRYIEAMTVVRPYIMKLAVWQRVPFVVAGLGLLLLPGSQAALWLVVLAPLSSGLVGGFVVNAWKEYIAGAIPDHQRSSMFGARYAIGALIGFLAGGSVSWVLARYPGTHGYGVLHLFAGAFLFASFAVFCLTFEGPPRAARIPAARASFWQDMREIGSLLKANRSVRAYAVTRTGYNGILIVVPFLGIHALAELGKSDAYLGPLLVAHTLGSLAGFLVGGYSGDRHGAKRSMVLSYVALLVVCAWSTWAHTEAGFLGVFFVLGLGQSLNQVAAATLELELGPIERRVTLQVAFGVFMLVGLVTASVTATLVRSLTSAFWVLSVPASVMLFAALAMLLSVPEPRRRLALENAE